MSGNNKTLIIGLGHKARRGKDTAAAHLIATFKDRYDIRRYAFADELKREFTQAVMNLMTDVKESTGKEISPVEAIRSLEEWAGVEHDYNMDMTDKLCPFGKPRPLLQWWGTEYRREGKVPGQPIPNPDSFYWVRKLRDRIRLEKPQIAIITDMRFLNEAAMVVSESLDNQTIRIERIGFELPGEAKNHRSETELDQYEYNHVITVADGPEGLEELKRDIVYVMNLIIEHLSAKYAVAGDEVFAKPLPVDPKEDGLVVLLPNHTKAVMYKISTPEGTRDATPEEVRQLLDAGSN